MGKTITPAMEDYLELILKLKQENKVARVRDIAKGLNVKMPSVTSMLNNLAKRNFISHEKYEYADLTASGLKKAKEAVFKHMILFNFLNNILKVNIRQADSDACRMEHTISPVTLKKLIGFIEFIESCPGVGSECLEYFKSNCRKEISKGNCERHMKVSIEERFLEEKEINDKIKSEPTK